MCIYAGCAVCDFSRSKGAPFSCYRHHSLCIYDNSPSDVSEMSYLNESIKL